MPRFDYFVPFLFFSNLTTALELLLLPQFDDANMAEYQMMSKSVTFL